MQESSINADDFITRNNQFVNKVCKLEGFKPDEITFLKEAMKVFIEKNWTDIETYKNCPF